MLYELLFPLRTAFSPFRVFQYISFRAAGAAVTALLVAFVVGPRIIRWLQSMQVHQVVREGTPATHAGKGTTPTMGGIIILAAILLPTMLWMRLNNTYVWIALLTTVWMGAIGFLDDYLKLRQKRAGLKNEGLVERWKLAGQVTLGVALGFYLWKVPLNSLPGASTTVPFFKNVLIVPATMGLAWVYVPFVTFVMTGTSNAVNLTDGLDGPASGLMAIAMGTFAVFAYAMGRTDASQAKTDVDSFAVLEPRADGFRNWVAPGVDVPAERLLVERLPNVSSIRIRDALAEQFDLVLERQRLRMDKIGFKSGFQRNYRHGAGYRKPIRSTGVERGVADVG